MMDYQQVLEFWFEELSPQQHWAKDEALDQAITQRFADCHRAATAGECWQWRSSPEGRLAEIIVLDQFSRNMYRNQPESFAWDALALVLAQEAVAQAADGALSAEQKSFLYMPYMHSESLLIHEQALELFSAEGLENNYEFELKHLAILERFGRYPHRNGILGRTSSPEEIEFLKQPGSGF